MPGPGAGYVTPPRCTSASAARNRAELAAPLGAKSSQPDLRLDPGSLSSDPLFAEELVGLYQDHGLLEALRPGRFEPGAEVPLRLIALITASIYSRRSRGAPCRRGRHQRLLAARAVAAVGQHDPLRSTRA